MLHTLIGSFVCLVCTWNRLGQIRLHHVFTNSLGRAGACFSGLNKLFFWVLGFEGISVMACFATVVESARIIRKGSNLADLSFHTRCTRQKLEEIRYRLWFWRQWCHQRAACQKAVQTSRKATAARQANKKQQVLEELKRRVKERPPEQVFYVPIESDLLISWIRWILLHFLVLQPAGYAAPAP